MEVEKRLSVEDLMKQRYKVIADYPDSIFKVGGILVEGEKDLTEAAKYPHLFKKLEWWQERKESEMPIFLRVGQNGILREVAEYLLNTGKVEFIGGKVRSIRQYIPATKKEFTEYLTLNK